MFCVSKYKSPLGEMTLLATEEDGLLGLWFDGQRYFAGVFSKNILHTRHEDNSVILQTKEWLDIYFKGKIPDFTPEIKLMGTPFREQVWKLLLEIPYGTVTTYGDIAKKLAKLNDKEKISAQAVGGAVGHNPISIIVPCHRVVASNGSLTGYAGGLDRKQKLLEIEQRKTIF